MASIIIERMIGFIVSLVMGLFGLIILSTYVNLDSKFNSIWYVGAIILLVGAALFAISFSQSFFDIIYKNVPISWQKVGLVKRIKSLHETYISYRTNKRSILIFSSLTIFEQLFAILFGWVIALSLYINVDLIFIAGVMPVSILIARLPVSFDGIGVFEGIFVVLMALGGISAAEAVSIALVGRIAQILSWMPWWLAHRNESGQMIQNIYKDQ